MAYANLNDDLAPHEEEEEEGRGTLFQEKVFSKFCPMGWVASGSWDLTFLVVLPGVLRLYDSQETFHSDPRGFVWELPTSSRGVDNKKPKKYFTSDVFEKDYSKEKYNPIIIKYCYVLKDNGVWSPTKMLKVGSSDEMSVKRFKAALKRSCDC